MKAVQITRFGGIGTIEIHDIPRPIPGAGQVLVRIKAAGVGPWDALVREGEPSLRQPLPLVLGAEFSGTVEAVGSGVTTFDLGEAVFGCTNAKSIGAYAEFAVADVGKIAPKPSRTGFVEAASVPIVATAAYQMVFEHGEVNSAKRILVLGAAGNVGAYAVQFAKRAGAWVLAVAFAEDTEYVRSLGADEVCSVGSVRFDEQAQNLDVVLDTVGGETLAQSLSVLRPGGIAVSIVSSPDPVETKRRGIRGTFFVVEVTSTRLNTVAEWLCTGGIHTHVGEVLPLDEARRAHEMLGGVSHAPGKIVLVVGAMNKEINKKMSKEMGNDERTAEQNLGAIWLAFAEMLPLTSRTVRFAAVWDGVALEAAGRDLFDVGVWASANEEVRSGESATGTTWGHRQPCLLPYLPTLRPHGCVGEGI